MTRLTYLFDPLCGWCYGATPALDAARTAPEVELVLQPTGLFADAQSRLIDLGFANFAWSNDQRIAALTGQSFTDRYRTEVLGDRSMRLDSGPATRALFAVHKNDPRRVFDALKAIQHARYVDGRDVTDPATLADLLSALSLPEAARDLVVVDANLIAGYRTWVLAGAGAMRRFGLRGVPSLLAGEGVNQRPLSSELLFGPAALLLAALADF